MMHRLVMNAPVGSIVDHINQNKFDNRLDNLRIATYSQNGQNKRKRKAPSSSRFVGVTLQEKRWRAYIIKDGVQHDLGSFVFEEDAARAYNVKAKELYGAFAHLNDVDEREKTAAPKERQTKRQRPHVSRKRAVTATVGP